MLDALEIGRRYATVMHRQDDTNIRLYALQERRHQALGRRDTAAVAELDVAIADLRTTQYDLRIAAEAAGGGDVARLDRNGRTAGLNWQDAASDPRAYATPRQIAREEYGALSVPAARVA